MDLFSNEPVEALSPAEEAKMADVAQEEANSEIKSLLPCDPCMDALADGIDEPEDPEVPDIGLGVESDLYDL